MPTKPAKVMPALYGGIIIAVLSTVPGLSLVNCLCCAGVMVGGLMSVYFYKNTLTPESSPLESGDGVQLGLLSGVFGAVVALVLNAVIQAAFGDIGATFVKDIMEKIVESGDMPPEVADKIRQSLAESGTAGARAMGIFFTFVTHIVIFPIFGLFGGLIGVSLFKSKTPPAPVQPQPPSLPQI